MMAPAANGDYFALDMATTTVAIGKVELAMRTKQEVPSVWGVDKDGKETTDPEKIYVGGGLLPLGGEMALNLRTKHVRLDRRMQA